MLKKVLACGVFFGVMAGVASANTTTVSCIGYVVSMSEDVAIKGQVYAGSPAAFEKVVCEHSKDHADFDSGVRSIPVYIEALDVATRVTLFVTKSDD